MTAPLPQLSVVIVTYNSADDIAACLKSLAGASAQSLQVIVVDNASEDQTVAIVRRIAPDASLITNRENRYYAAASNQGLARVESAFVLLLNPDCVLPEGGIDALLEFLDAHPDAAAVVPRLVSPEGKRQCSLRELPGLDTLWYDLTGFSFLFPRSRRFGRWRMGYFDGESVRTVPQPMASCLLIRRSALEAIGGFDERYPMFFNDVDWCRRLSEAGRRIYYTPAVSVRHVGGSAINRRKVRMIWMGHRAYFTYLRRLYASRPLGLTLVWLSGPFLLAAAIARSVWWGVIRRRPVGQAM